MNWKKRLEQEFKIHFKDSPDEFGFLEVFIEEELEKQKKEFGRKIIEILRGLYWFL